jgi:signal transduction histidine kinase
MFFTNSLRKKLFRSVFIVVASIVLSAAAVVTWFEKQRHQQMELNRIYYETREIKQQLGHLLFNEDFRSLMIVLSNAKSANPGILYFTVTDLDGIILVADNDKMVGSDVFSTVSVENLSAPLATRTQFESKEDEHSRFEIYSARLNADVQEGTLIRGRTGEKVFDTWWDVDHMGNEIGRLRIGYSERDLNQRRVDSRNIILVFSFVVLILALVFIYWQVRLGLNSLQEFSNKLAVLYSANTGEQMRHHLENVTFEERPTDAQEIRQLKGAFSKLKDRFVKDWDQLENHRHNLETMVEERTRELNKMNTRLVRQIHERKEIEARLLNVQKLEAVGTLAGGIAHEFNNLFMAITGYAALIQKQAGPGHSTAKKAEKIRCLVDNGSESIKQLLGFARSGKYSADKLNINEIIRVNLEMFKRTRKDIDIVTQCETDIWNIIADRSQMEHVLMNLLLNASEAMPESGAITVETRNIVLHKKQVRLDKTVSGRFVMIGVRDQGKGIDKEMIPRIFDPFFTTKPMSAGTGLGLASVYGIVDNHGGFVTVESTMGKGSCFSIFLPAASREKKGA